MENIVLDFYIMERLEKYQFVAIKPNVHLLNLKHGIKILKYTISLQLVALWRKIKLTMRLFSYWLQL